MWRLIGNEHPSISFVTMSFIEDPYLLLITSSSCHKFCQYRLWDSRHCALYVCKHNMAIWQIQNPHKFVDLNPVIPSCTVHVRKKIDYPHWLQMSLIMVFRKQEFWTHVAFSKMNQTTKKIWIEFSMVSLWDRMKIPTFVKLRAHAEPESWKAPSRRPAWLSLELCIIKKSLKKLDLRVRSEQSAWSR